jgi:hypothetical protein
MTAALKSSFHDEVDTGRSNESSDAYRKMKEKFKKNE